MFAKYGNFGFSLVNEMKLDNRRELVGYFCEKFCKIYKRDKEHFLA